MVRLLEMSIPQDLRSDLMKGIKSFKRKRKRLEE
jgi:hypothetical protein